MPKVIVREIDNTKAVTSAYSNFSVVIPGYVKNEADFNKVADDNGVYECSSTDDFNKYIGGLTNSDAANLGAVAAKEPTAVKYDVGKLTMADAKTLLATGKLYTRATGGTEIGTLVEKVEGTFYTYTAIKDEDLEGYFTAPTTSKNEDDADKSNYVSNVDLYYIKTGDEGNNANSTETRVGNRLAYLLIKLGYTILYKKIESSAGEASLTQPDFWECFKDKSTYDFRYICTGGRYDPNIYQQIIQVAGKQYVDTELTDTTVYGRGDVTALIDVNEEDTTAFASYVTSKTQSAAITAIKSWVTTNDGIFNISSKDIGKYVGIFAPRTIINVAKDMIDNLAETDDVSNGSTYDIVIPGSFYYLACAAKAQENNYAEWYAVAGYQRGISDLTVVGTTLPLGDLAVQSLEPRTGWQVTSSTETTSVGGRSVNVITKLRTVGNTYYLWGSRTAHKLTSDDLVASHFLNIRQLCTTLKKDIYIACKQLAFNPNDMILLVDFKEKIRPTLEAMKGDRGIKDYKFENVADSRKALLKVKIKIVPIEPVEDFDIGVYLEDSVNGTTDVSVDVTESD